MATPNPNAIREFLSDDVLDLVVLLEVFAEIDSTNSYLMQKTGPVPGRACIAATTNQTAGRGRRGRVWRSPRDSGVAVSVAYTYRSQPSNLSALTLAIGLSAISALEDLGVSGLQLKWPNDLVVNDNKLGGILTEAQQQANGSVTVVTGIGINMVLPTAMSAGDGSEWATGIVDLASVMDEIPTSDSVIGTLIEHLLKTFVEFEVSGFGPYEQRWQSRDWLLGRDIVVDSGGERIRGTGAGVANDGSLLVATSDMGTRLVLSGSIVKAGPRGLNS